MADNGVKQLVEMLGPELGPWAQDLRVLVGGQIPDNFYLNRTNALVSYSRLPRWETIAKLNRIRQISQAHVIYLEFLNGQEDGSSFRHLGISRSKKATKERVQEIESFLENPSKYLYG